MEGEEDEKEGGGERGEERKEVGRGIGREGEKGKEEKQEEGKKEEGERVKWKERVNHHSPISQSLSLLTSSPGPRSLSCLVTMSMSTIMSVV